jgi:uncharacterized Ntn-hydrolase superfamily protein
MIELNTFSIAARCRTTGRLGVAVATAVPAVGSMCPFVRSGVGAVSTQSWVNPYLAIDALAALAEGLEAQAALERALARDDGRDLRQIGLVDAQGRSAAWTGAACTPFFGQETGEDFAIQGNMLAGPEVIAGMVEAFRSSAGESLQERLMRCLEAGEEAGGDKRGKQSAAIRIHATEDYPLLDIRIDEHRQPVTELRRVLGIAERQLMPFVEGMPRKGSAAGPVPEEVAALLALSPEDR